MNTITAPALTLSDKIIVLREARKEYAAIQSMVSDYRYALDHPDTNAFGQRLSMSHCVHGITLWSDCDTPCGQCEDGQNFYFYESLTFTEVLADMLSAFRAHKVRTADKMGTLLDAIVVLTSLTPNHDNMDTVAVYKRVAATLAGRWA